MLKICTVYFKGCYTPDYVSKLYRSLKRNSSIPFEFICLSDTKDIEADIVLPYNHHDIIKIHWHKLKFFSPQFAYQEPGDDIIIMDIDQIITNNIDDLLGWEIKENELLTYGSWWSSGFDINGGFYKFKSGSLKFVWDEFISSANFWQEKYFKSKDVYLPYYGEQNYVKGMIEKYKSKLIRTPEEWVCRYTDNLNENIALNKLYCKKFNTDYMILGDVNNKIKSIHFTGYKKNIHECNDSFIKEYWK